MTDHRSDPGSSLEFHICGLKISGPTTTTPAQGRTPGGEDSTAELTEYLCGGLDGQLRLGYFAWANGERHVGLVGGSTLPRLRNVEGRRRLPIRYSAARQREYCYLRLARAASNNWSQLVAATLDEISEAAECPATETLLGLGAISVATAERALGIDNRNRNLPVATFRTDDRIVPLAAFVLTRLLPLANAPRDPA